MAKHYIIMSSSYTDGKRVALDITESSLLTEDVIAQIIKEIRHSCGSDVPLSSHLIETHSECWESVKRYDPFFEEVDCVKTTSEFIERIKKGRDLSGLDVANYILSKLKCTHLSLEKLVYFAYADYLCKYSEQLFKDDIYAFSHGPVVDSVYKTYKQSGYKYVTPCMPDSDQTVQTEIKEMPAKSRILFAKDGVRKLQSIDQTIEKYGKYTAGSLVSFTHREKSPWSHVDSTKRYQIISDELIAAYHYIECQ